MGSQDFTYEATHSINMKTIWAILCPLILATLVSGQNQYLNIRNIRMSTYAWMKDDSFYGWSSLCGGDRVKIQLINQGSSCEVSLSGGFNRNDVLTWSSDDELLACKHMPVTESTIVKVQTRSSDQFCPKTVTIEASNGKKFESIMTKQWYGQHTNSLENPLSKTGIERIVMPMYEDQRAGGKKIKVRINTGGANGIWCTTKVIPIVYGRQVVSWEGEELNGCEMMDVNDETDVYLQTEKRGDSFAPRKLEIEMNDKLFTRWEARLGPFNRNEYRFDRNNQRRPVKQMWPPEGRVVEPRPKPLTCPSAEDTCPASDMYSYKLLSNRRMNCVFECPYVSQTNYSTNIDVTDGTGHRCIRTDYESSQFNWCCKSRATTGIPKCSDVIGSNGQVLEGQNNSQPPPRRTQLQCPSQGCPIFAIEEQSALGFVTESCQPGCSKLNALNSTESGFRCTPVTFQLPKTIFCCKDNQVDTTLPRCDSLTSPQEDNSEDSNDPGNADENETSENPLNVASGNSLQERLRQLRNEHGDVAYNTCVSEYESDEVDFNTCIANLQQTPEEHMRQLREEHGEEAVNRCLSHLADGQDEFEQCINSTGNDTNN